MNTKAVKIHTEFYSFLSIQKIAKSNFFHHHKISQINSTPFYLLEVPYLIRNVLFIIIFNQIYTFKKQFLHCLSTKLNLHNRIPSECKMLPVHRHPEQETAPNPLSCSGCRPLWNHFPTFQKGIASFFLTIFLFPHPALQ